MILQGLGNDYTIFWGSCLHLQKNRPQHPFKFLEPLSYSTLVVAHIEPLKGAL